MPGQWSHLTSGAREESREEAATGSEGNSPSTPQTPSATSAASKRKSTGSMSITKFMKRYNDREQVTNVHTLKKMKTLFAHIIFLNVCQTEGMEADGFQADTEEDDDECIIVSMQTGEQKKPTKFAVAL